MASEAAPDEGANDGRRTVTYIVTYARRPDGRRPMNGANIAELTASPPTDPDPPGPDQAPSGPIPRVFWVPTP